jgi:hypothetical protein
MFDLDACLPTKAGKRRSTCLRQAGLNLDYRVKILVSNPLSGFLVFFN